jgi:hypothetical protein
MGSIIGAAHELDDQLICLVRRLTVKQVANMGYLDHLRAAAVLHTATGGLDGHQLIVG